MDYRTVVHIPPSRMNHLLTIPLEIRLALLAVIGAWVGGQLNRAIYRFAYRRREISPWSQRPESAPPRTWIDCMPIVGWFYLRREAEIHGDGFWVRPLLIELCTAVAFAWLYFWEIQGELLPSSRAVVLAGPVMLHAQYLSHVVLMCLMIVATFIDFDEKTIPDLVTVPGTLFALLLVTLLPAANLPVIVPAPPPAGATIGPIMATTPLPWRADFNGSYGLAIACLSYLVWIAALLHYTWTTRHGWKKALAYCFASLVRNKGQIIRSLIVAAAGLAWIVAVWSAGGPRWQALLSALIGLAGGGGLVWMIRIIASHSLGKEAMGFGDVTLMAMVGSFLGWQAAVMIFFMAPVIGSLIAVVQWIITRRQELAFGPYLCAATAVLVVCWDPIWNGWAVDIFSLGWFIPLVLFACVGLMGVMLMIWRGVKAVLFAT